MTSPPSPIGPPSALAAFEALLQAGRSTWTQQWIVDELVAAFAAQVERADRAEAEVELAERFAQRLDSRLATAEAEIAELQARPQ